MPDLLLILFKINLVLLLFATTYYLILRRLTFYTLNRIFLVGGILFSTIYPFIDLTDFFQRQQQLTPGVGAFVPGIDVKELIGKPYIMDYWQAGVLLFYVGAACMAARLCIQFISLYRIHRNSSPGAVNNLPVRILKGQISPFSFWQTVYINPELHAENELDTILAHEQVHVKEWHTLDIILAEVSAVFYWFNPGVWLMKRAIKENIEFITDARIVKRGIDKKSYQYSLLGIGNLENKVSLVNNFNLSDLKKRIKMMNAKRSSPKKLLLYAFILPVLLITTLAFTINKKAMEKHLDPLTRALPATPLFIATEKPAATIIPEQLAKPAPKAPVSKKQKALLPAKKITFISNIVRIQLDSTDGPKEKNIEIVAKATLMPALMSGMVKGIRLTPADFSDTTSSAERSDSRKTVQIVIKKGTVSSSGEFSTPLWVQGFKSTARPVSDSLKLTNVTFVLEGKPVSAEEIKKLNADQIKHVMVQRVPGGEAGIIKVTGQKR